MAVGPTAVYEQLTILLTLGVVSHLFSKRFHQSTLIGEIIIGILLAPSLLGSFGILVFDPGFVSTFAALGAIFLLFLIGLESDFRELYTRKNFFVALGGVLFPLAFGVVTAWFLAPPSGPTTYPATANGQLLMAVFVGATLTATSTAIAASILLDLGLIKHDLGRTILGAAVVDDILGLIILSAAVGMVGGEVDPLGIAIVIGKAVVFIVVGILVGLYFFNPVVVRVQVEGHRLGVRHGGFIIALAVALLYSLIAETIGLSAIIGAFLAGTLFTSAPLKEEFTDGARYLEAVFTPIFFISLGLNVDLFAVLRTPQIFVFTIALVLVAMVTKVAGCGIPARLQKMTALESIAVGWGMTPRGEVGLIVAVTALAAGIIGGALFSVIVFVILVVSVAPAPLFKQALRAVERERAARAAESAPAEN